MAFQAITMTVLTHPLQVLLMGMVVLQGVRMTISAVRQRRTGCDSNPLPTTARLDLQAAA
jgi:hypothetical protein